MKTSNQTSLCYLSHVSISWAFRRWAAQALVWLILCLSGAHAQIESADYHIHRDFGRSFTQFEEEGLGRVAFLGGSITYNPGWRDSISVFLQKTFPKTRFDFIAAGIPSMGSTPGAFRLERDILSKGRVDLLFVEAAVNDPTNGRSSTEQIRGMEGIIRHARYVFPAIDIIAMYFVDPSKMESYYDGRVPEVILNHDSVAAHYQVSSINLAHEVTDRITAGDFTWEDDFKDLHPSPFGQIVYFESMKSFLQNAQERHSTADLSATELPKKIDEFSYDKGRLIPIDQATAVKLFEIIPRWGPADSARTRDGYVDVPMLVGAEPGAALSLEFSGRAIGISVAAGPDAGVIEYQIDGGPPKQMDLFTRWSQFLHLPWYYVLEAELSPGTHHLMVTISDTRNAKSIGHAVRIKQFFVNE